MLQGLELVLQGLELESSSTTKFCVSNTMEFSKLLGTDLATVAPAAAS